MAALFNVNGTSIQTPIGSFVAIGNTSSFVSGIYSGWVFCDGVARSNASGIYTNLANMGIGSNSGGNYTSPNLSSALMSGNRDGTVAINTFQGNINNTITLTEANLPSHNHTITIGTASHYHTLIDYVPNVNNGSNNGITILAGDQSNPTGTNTTGTTKTRTSNSTNDAHTHTIAVGDVINQAYGYSFSIKNTAFHVQWIVKYA